MSRRRREGPQHTQGENPFVGVVGKSTEDNPFVGVVGQGSKEERNPFEGVVGQGTRPRREPDPPEEVGILDRTLSRARSLFEGVSDMASRQTEDRVDPGPSQRVPDRQERVAGRPADRPGLFDRAREAGRGILSELLDPAVREARRAEADEILAGARKPSDSEFFRGTRTGIAGFRTAAGNILEAVGDEERGAELKESGEKAREAVRPRVSRIEDVRGVDDLVDFALFQAGQGIASTLPPLVGGVAGGLVAGPPGAVAGAILPAAGLNFGEMRDALEAEGVEGDDLDVLSAVATVPLAALDVVVPARLGRTLTGNARRQVVRGLARRVAGQAGRSAGEELVTEGAQTALQQGVVSGAVDIPFLTRENFSEVLNAMIAGGLTGGVLGGATTVASEAAPSQATFRRQFRNMLGSSMR